MYLPSGAEERVVWNEEGLTCRQITRTRELPYESPLRVDDDEPVVPLVGDQEIGGQHAWIRPLAAGNLRYRQAATASP